MSPIARIIAAGAALAAVATAGVATAQNYGLNPTYGTVALNSGFTPDPYVVNVQSGGSIDAQTLSSSCRGFIADAPDVRLNFSAGSLPLILSAASNADTTLVVNAPDGTWYCDDDSGNAGMNPMVRFNNPQGGQYDIWIVRRQIIRDRWRRDLTEALAHLVVDPKQLACDGASVVGGWFVV